MRCNWKSRRRRRLISNPNKKKMRRRGRERGADEAHLPPSLEEARREL
jgi:hypothetical protein